MVKAILLDFDGTISDTSEGVMGCAQKAVDDFGLNIKRNREQLKGLLGPTLYDSFTAVFGLDDSIVFKVIDHFKALYDEYGYAQCKPYAGIREMLVSLKEKGYKLGIASYKIHEQVLKCADICGVSDLMDTIRGADEEGKLRKFEIIRLAMEDLGATGEETLMVGDTENDRIGAELAGTLFLGVAFGFGYDESTKLEKWKIVAKPEDVVAAAEAL